jgi:TRAP-type C4-dicarboxylate transport system permease small subunit
VLRPSLQRLVYVVVLLCIGAFCWVLVAEGLPLAIRNAAQTSPSARIPMIVPYVSVAVGGFLMLIQVACLLVLIATGRADPPRAAGT